MSAVRRLCRLRLLRYLFDKIVNTLSFAIMFSTTMLSLDMRLFSIFSAMLRGLYFDFF